MREVIHLQVGQFGNKVGHKFWELLLSEHGLSNTGSYQGSSPNTQLAQTESYFDESDSKVSKTYTPRALVVDMDPGVTDWMRASSVGECIRPDNYISGEYGTGCFANGHYDQGAGMLPEIMDAVRREVERCDSLQGFQIVHALGGGTGSGLGARIIMELATHYPFSCIFTFSHFPNPTFGYQSVVEPYNTVLSTHYLIESATSTVCVDEGVEWRRVQDGHPSRAGFEHLVASMMADVTACNRFTGPLPGNFHTLQTNLVIYPRMHFFVPSVAQPTHSPLLYNYTLYALPILIQQLFDSRNIMATVGPPSSGKIISVIPMFRGELNACEIEQQTTKLTAMESTTFVEWMPNNIKCILTNPPVSAPLPPPTSLSYLFTPSEAPPPSLNPSQQRISATALTNTSAITNLFNPILNDFCGMFHRKAYLRPYHNHMDEMEFTEAQSNLEDLILEYEHNTLNNFNEE